LQNGHIFFAATFLEICDASHISKGHRPDLKQLLVVLTMGADGNVPAAFRCADGNTSDARTHIETWNTLRAVAGRADFLYVADSKLCSRENMDYIDRAGGRFITVLPRTRLEDQEFRKWIQTHTPAWELVWDRPNPRNDAGPRDRWYVYRAPLLSAEVNHQTGEQQDSRCSPDCISGRMSPEYCCSVLGMRWCRPHHVDRRAPPCHGNIDKT
jgi:hypothetical protein